MKRLTGNADHLHLLVRHFSPRWILATVEAAGDSEPLRGSRARDQAHDRLVVPQRLATPVRRDEGKEAVLDLVPLAGPRRQVADRYFESCLVGQFL